MDRRRVNSKEFTLRFLGFTLLELVVATTLAAVLGGATVLVLGRGINAWTRADGRLQQLFSMEKALVTLAEELRNGVSLGDSPFQGSGEELFFPKGTDSTQLVLVRYRLLREPETVKLLREQLPYPEEEQEAIPKTLIEGVRSLSIEYGQLSEEGGQKVLTWTSSWDSSVNPMEFPKLLKVSLETEDPRGGILKLSCEIWIPHGVLRSVEAGGGSIP